MQVLLNLTELRGVYILDVVRRVSGGTIIDGLSRISSLMSAKLPSRSLHHCRSIYGSILNIENGLSTVPNFFIA